MRPQNLRPISEECVGNVRIQRQGASGTISISQTLVGQFVPGEGPCRSPLSQDRRIKQTATTALKALESGKVRVGLPTFIRRNRVCLISREILLLEIYGYLEYRSRARYRGRGGVDVLKTRAPSEAGR
ncbi:hypothetical protein EVAR_64580_1 [Eumeta japonica]|uniref:Uncharacterized protein n=1 Tax=Eumeta variegata TaxID=151549 RepID=A0A4C1ZLZ7_EUMVA|nr:hypothetical protein EVAR_64580_1 [Eumeta japonica]